MPVQMSSSADPCTVTGEAGLGRRYFPGWTMLGFAAAGQFMSAPGQSHSVAALKDPMRATLKITETDFSLAYGFATLVGAALLPIFGRLIDRFGARVMLPLVAAGLGVACFQMSRIQSLSGLFLGFSFVRTLGQGALVLVSVWLVGEWFERKRGMATAIAGLGGGLSVMTIPIVNDFLIQSYGWESTWVVLAVIVTISLVLPGILFIRDRPEDLGLHPDGIRPDYSEEPATRDVGNSNTGKPQITPLEQSWTAVEAVRNPTFWKLLSVPVTSGIVGTGLIFHQVALFGEHGLSSREALGLISVQALFATVMTFPAGYVTDRVASRYLLATSMLTLAAATLLAINLPVMWMALVYALLMGFHSSIIRSAGNVVWVNYYGRAHQGEVRGVAWAVMILGSAIGPLPLAYSIDTLSTYTPALYGLLVLPLVAALVVWTATPPRRRQ